MQTPLCPTSRASAGFNSSVKRTTTRHQDPRRSLVQVSCATARCQFRTIPAPHPPYLANVKQFWQGTAAIEDLFVALDLAPIGRTQTELPSPSLDGLMPDSEAPAAMLWRKIIGKWSLRRFLCLGRDYTKGVRYHAAAAGQTLRQGYLGQGGKYPERSPPRECSTFPSCRNLC